MMNYLIRENREIAKDTYILSLEGDTTWVYRPGQFVNITVENGYLKRPMSIADYSENELILIYKVLGRGTTWLSEQKPGKKLEMLVGLGNGFEIGKEEKALVVGGGLGIPPLYALTRKLVEMGKEVTVVLGFQSKEYVFFESKFKELTEDVIVLTDDGSYGERGLVTKAILDKDLSKLPYYTCGPLPMLKAVYEVSKARGRLSFEERMGCGFGECMGCSKKVKGGYKRVCLEGPVFESEELLWEELV